MTKALITLGLLVSVTSIVAGHPGHDYKFMGSVTLIHENHLEVKTTDDTTQIITVNEKTKILRGTKAVEIDDIEVGERIVVIARQEKQEDGRDAMVAREVRLGMTARSGSDRSL